MSFSPDDIGIANGNYFGFPFSIEQSDLVLISAPWDVTVSYNKGAAKGPEAIIEASAQVEIYDIHAPNVWKRGIATLPVDNWILEQSKLLRPIAEEIIGHIESGGDISEVQKQLDQINQAGKKLNSIIFEQAITLLDQNKIVGLVGGDHSTPLGLIQALAKKHDSFGILHIDAHCDLRKAYEGFEFSHASIMYNALKIPQITRLTQVAIRDFSQIESEFAKKELRIAQFTDYDLKEGRFKGKEWHKQCQEIIDTLPQKVYVSFDIDGLSQEYCPATGTPVPGGLTFNEAIYLLVELHESGRTIIGFDLNEVSPGNSEWDANVGARVLYKLCNLTLSDSKKSSISK